VQMNINLTQYLQCVLIRIPFPCHSLPLHWSTNTGTVLGGQDIQTSNKVRARRVARQLRSGMVEMNGKFGGAGSPFGGMKHSGNGREGGTWGLEEFLEVKAVSDWE